MRDTWNMTPDEARKYILQNWFDGDENVNAFVCGDEEYTAMAIAVEALEATKWHYPSKGELPTESGNYLTACKTDDGLLARCIKFYDAKFKKWESHIEVYAWWELPDLPKDVSLEKQVRIPYSYLVNKPPKEEVNG